MLKGAAASSLALLHSTLPAWARSGARTDLTGLSALAGTHFDLNVDHAMQTIDGRSGHAVLINGQLPAPLLRWREGDEVVLNVTNHLDEDTSIHWHGLLLPPNMDGVPGVSFAGIKPGTTFTYQFPIKQAGTYWYHSHSADRKINPHIRRRWQVPDGCCGCRAWHGSSRVREMLSACRMIDAQRSKRFAYGVLLPATDPPCRSPEQASLHA